MEEQKKVIRKLRLNHDFAVGVLAQGFAHRFKVIEGIPHDARIVNVKLDSEAQQLVLSIESATFKPEDEKKLLQIVIHELAS